MASKTQCRYAVVMGFQPSAFAISTLVRVGGYHRTISNIAMLAWR
jgi:hypothetical protein